MNPHFSPSLFYPDKFPTDAVVSSITDIPGLSIVILVTPPVTKVTPPTNSLALICLL